jgi:multidrug transporter EmrE-like cation transporter
MKLHEFALILAGVALNAAAQLLLKAGVRLVGPFEFSAGNILPVGSALASNLHILGGLGCYAVSVIAWILALSRVDVSVAYPMLSIGYVLNALLAHWLFGETLSAQKLLGIAVIIVGVAILGRSS